MKIKIFEIRDRATFIPVIAIKLEHQNDEQAYHLVDRCGYNPMQKNVMITRLGGEGEATADPYHWDDRTLQTAHLHILDAFDNLNDGDVIDVEFILGEVDKPKISERFTNDIVIFN